MNKKHYEIYENPAYMKALNELLEDSEYTLSPDQELPEHFILRYAGSFEEELVEDPNNIEAQNALVFIDRCYYLMEHEERYIFDYYSEEYKKNFYISWDSEGCCEVISGNIVSMVDDHMIFQYILKPKKLTYIRRCKSLGLKNDRTDFEMMAANSAKGIHDRIYRKETLKDDPFICAVLWD
jgi:hypothetical protein